MNGTAVKPERIAWGDRIVAFVQAYGRWVSIATVVDWLVQVDAQRRTPMSREKLERTARQAIGFQRKAGRLERDGDRVRAI
jgi:hypothetical protein